MHLLIICILSWLGLALAGPAAKTTTTITITTTKTSEKLTTTTLTNTRTIKETTALATVTSTSIIPETRTSTIKVSTTTTIVSRSTVVSLTTTPSTVISFTTKPSTIISFTTSPSTIVSFTTVPSTIVSYTTTPSTVVSLVTVTSTRTEYTDRCVQTLPPWSSNPPNHWTSNPPNHWTSVPPASFTASSQPPWQTDPNAHGQRPDCPRSNGTVYTAISGRRFQLQCGIDLYGNDILPAAKVRSIEACADRCTRVKGCIAITYIPNWTDHNCYFKRTVAGRRQQGREEMDSMIFAPYIPQSSAPVGPTPTAVNPPPSTDCHYPSGVKCMEITGHGYPTIDGKVLGAGTDLGFGATRTTWYLDSQGQLWDSRVMWTPEKHWTIGSRDYRGGGWYQWAPPKDLKWSNLTQIVCTAKSNGEFTCTLPGAQDVGAGPTGITSGSDDFRDYLPIFYSLDDPDASYYAPITMTWAPAACMCSES